MLKKILLIVDVLMFLDELLGIVNIYASHTWTSCRDPGDGHLCPYGFDLCLYLCHDYCLGLSYVDL